MAVTRELLVRFASEFDTMCLGVGPTTELCLFYSNDITECVQVHKMHWGCFWAKETLKPRKDTTWSVPKCVLKCFLV